MQRRLVGSVVVVAAGLLPAVVGGPVFAALMLGIGIVALKEFLALGRDAVLPAVQWSLYGALVVAVGGALFSKPTLLLMAIVLGVLVPLALSLCSAKTPGAAEAWTWGVSGVWYIAFPVCAAILLRQATGGEVTSGWDGLASRLALGWTPAPAGMTWVLAVVLSTWTGDSAAYLTGRALGRRKLAPLVSPGKTIEGALGGLAAAMVVSATVFRFSGLFPLWAGALVGAILGAFGQLGDLSESFLKRQADVKDSGDLIPGHGGMLDRIDALLFAFPAALLVNWIVEGVMR